MTKVTSESLVLNRRQWLKRAAAAGLFLQFPWLNQIHASGLKITPENKATRYNNYYEFSDNKEVVVHLAKAFKMSPWDLDVSGLVENPLHFSLDKLPESEERIYRFRCVEGWSMTVPWQGFPLHKLIELARPKSDAKYVRFVGTHRPSEMIGQRREVFDWPYQEGLRLDEAIHPLTILATGMYGKHLPPQNGGPLRLVVPWKYGFKSIKAITRIELVSEEPNTTWNQRAPEEYGFYANVNPNVAHPRWSQRREVPLGETRKIKTLAFNGYEKEVSHLYKNMDLAKYY